MKRRGTRRRQAITLLELLVVVALVGMMGTIVAVNATAWIRQERFHASVHTVRETLTLAQDLMLAVGADCRVRFEELSPGEWQCVVEVMDPLPKSLDRLLVKTRTLPGVGDVRFQDRDGQWVLKDIALPFMSYGGWMPQGNLIVSGRDEERKIRLYGYPRPSGMDAQEGPEFWLEESERLYPTQVEAASARPAT